MDATHRSGSSCRPAEQTGTLRRIRNAAVDYQPGSSGVGRSAITATIQTTLHGVRCAVVAAEAQLLRHPKRRCVPRPNGRPDSTPAGIECGVEQRSSGFGRVPVPMRPRQQLIRKLRLIKRATPNDDCGVSQASPSGRLRSTSAPMPVVSIVFVMTSIRSSASATVNVPVPRAFSNSVNHSASLGSSGVKMSRSVSIRGGIVEGVTRLLPGGTPCAKSTRQVARTAAQRKQRCVRERTDSVTASSGAARWGAAAGSGQGSDHSPLRCSLRGRPRGRGLSTAR